MLPKTLNPIWIYIKDCMNLLARTLVGLLILAIGLALPDRSV